MTIDREALGRRVRELWVEFARTNPPACGWCDGRGYLFLDCTHDGPTDHRLCNSTRCDICEGRGRVPKPHHVAPWEELDEQSKEVDRIIGETVAREAEARGMERVAQAVIKTSRELTYSELEFFGTGTIEGCAERFIEEARALREGGAK